MKDQKNGKQNEGYLVYLNGRPIPVNKEVYEEYYRPIWRTHDFMQNHGRCEQANWRRCSGDCGICAYQVEGDSISLDYLRESSDFEFGVPCNDPADIIENKVLLENIFVAADQLVPDGKRTLELFLEGKTDRVISDSLGIPYSTFSKRKLKLFRELRKFF